MDTLSRKIRWATAAILSALLFIVVGPLNAQGGTLTYGSIASADLNASAPIVIFPFSGTAGDQVTIRVFATSASLQPTVSLFSPSQQQLATNSGGPFAPGTAELNYTLPVAGVYTIFISSTDGISGSFAVRLDGNAAPPTVNVSGETSEPTTLSETSVAAVYNVQANPDAPVTVTINTTTPDFSYAAAVRDAQGTTLSVLNGSEANPIVTILPPGTTAYTFEVRPVEGGTTGNILLSLNSTAAVSSQGAPATATEAVSPTPFTTQEGDATVCSATASSTINVRSGPATTYDVIASMNPGGTLPVTGVSSAGDWYVVALSNDMIGWVFGDLVTLSGPCNDLPTVNAPDVPEQTATSTPTVDSAQTTATFTPSFTPTAPPVVQATATFTPSFTPTTPAAQATATFTPSYTPTTPPAAQLAPEDARFNNPLDIPLDNTVSVLDFVSYPGGDREDRVRYSVSGMNPNVAITGGRARMVISVSCFGENTEQIEFFTGGQSYSCGSTIVDREVTADSDTGSIVITAVGGENTYVQWVLTGTATRVN